MEKGESRMILTLWATFGQKWPGFDKDGNPIKRAFTKNQKPKTHPEQLSEELQVRPSLVGAIQVTLFAEKMLE